MLKNPYKGLPEDKRTRCNADVSTDDWHLIRLVASKHGVSATIVSQIIYAIANELRTKHIHSWSPDNERELYAIVDRRAAAFAANAAPGQDESRGVAKVRGKGPGAKKRTADAARSVNGENAS